MRHCVPYPPYASDCFFMWHAPLLSGFRWLGPVPGHRLGLLQFRRPWLVPGSGPVRRRQPPALLRSTPLGILAPKWECTAGQGLGPDSAPVPRCRGGRSAIATAIAALMVAYDRCFGCSSAWIRFIATEHEVRQALHQFQYDIEHLQHLQGQVQNHDSCVGRFCISRNFSKSTCNLPVSVGVRVACCTTVADRQSAVEPTRTYLRRVVK